MPKQAILVVSFGTSYHDTCEKNIGAVEQEIAQSFPGHEIRRAFTSSMIREKLKKRDNLAVDSVAQALQRLAEDGFTHIFLQPTHVINGEEFDGIVKDAAAYQDKFSQIQVGTPLLTYTEDYEQFTEIMSALYPQQEDVAYCLMGHGSGHHPADAAYAALDYRFGAMGRNDFFVGTVEGFPDLEAMMRRLAASAPRKCVLIPLMVVAGDHACNDMASDQKDSWKTRLQKKGYTVECLLRGLGEYPPVRQMYVEHIRGRQNGTR